MVQMVVLSMVQITKYFYAVVPYGLMGGMSSGITDNTLSFVFSFNKILQQFFCIHLVILYFVYL